MPTSRTLPLACTGGTEKIPAEADVSRSMGQCRRVQGGRLRPVFRLTLFLLKGSGHCHVALTEGQRRAHTKAM